MRISLEFHHELATDTPTPKTFPVTKIVTNTTFLSILIFFFLLLILRSKKTLRWHRVENECIKFEGQRADEPPKTFKGYCISTL